MGNNSARIAKKENSKRRRFIVTGGVLLVVMTMAAGSFLYFRKPTPSELYKQSVVNAINTQSDQVYGSFNINTDSTKLQGEFIGSPDSKSNDTSFRANYDVTFMQDDVPLVVSAEMIVIGKEDQNKKDASEGYFKYKSLTTTKTEYKQNVENYFSPILNKWVKLEDKDKSEDKPTSFEEDGPLAAFEVLGIFVPVVKLNENDQKTFLSAMNKYDLYQVGKKVETEKFKGIESRKVQVSVKKDALLEFENEVSETLSDDANFEKLESKFIDQLFGDSNELSINVFIDLDEARFIGADINLDLDKPITETEFNTLIDKISTSILIEYDRKLTIEVPESAITQAEVNALLGN